MYESECCRFGHKFKCDNRDLSTPISIQSQGADSTAEELAADVAEFIGQHAVEVWSTLKSFKGYDTLQFKLK